MESLGNISRPIPPLILPPLVVPFVNRKEETTRVKEVLRQGGVAAIMGLVTS